MPPTIMRITPTVLMLNPCASTLTANVRIAPRAMRTREVPMGMCASLPLCEGGVPGFAGLRPGANGCPVRSRRIACAGHDQHESVQERQPHRRRGDDLQDR